MELALGPGEGARLLAVGEPDWLGADGVRLGFVMRDRLFLVEGGRARVVELPAEAHDVAVTPERWVVAHPDGFSVVDPAAAEVVALAFDDDAEPLATWPGRDVVVFGGHPRSHAARLSDAFVLPLPDGARRSRWLRPFATGEGLVWVDGGRVYRLARRGEAVGAVGAVEGLAVGPEGALLVASADESWVAAAGRGLVEVPEPLGAEGARFVGGEVWAPTPDGMVAVELRTGRVTRRWDGELTPAGAGWWRDRRAVRGDEGVVLDRLGGPVVASGGGWIAGPGGATWARGRVVLDDLPDGVAGTDGAQVVVADATTLRRLGGASSAHTLCVGDDDIAAVEVDGDLVRLLTVDGELGVYGPDGALRERRRVKRRRSGPEARWPDGVVPDDDAGTVVVDGVPFPIPADGAVRDGASVWVYSDDGLLVQLG